MLFQRSLVRRSVGHFSLVLHGQFSLFTKHVWYGVCIRDTRFILSRSSVSGRLAKQIASKRCNKKFLSFFRSNRYFNFSQYLKRLQTAFKTFMKSAHFACSGKAPRLGISEVILMCAIFYPRKWQLDTSSQSLRSPKAFSDAPLKRLKGLYATGRTASAKR